MMIIISDDSRYLVGGDKESDGDHDDSDNANY
jgi:hypothetical protein